jgi:ABC-type sugar transport system ATPase subunit
MSSISLRGISKSFGSVQALRELDLEVQDGEFLSLLGPSGCGKTTTLRLVAGLEEPTTGDVFMDDDRVTHLAPADRDIAMVFQLYALYPYMSIRENIAFPLRAQGVPASETRKRVDAVAELLGIEELLSMSPGQVHPAQGQRVAIAKAIVREPRVFLFDEPLSHLDAHMRSRMRAELKHLHDTVGRTTLFVTHDQAEGLAISDRIGVMRQGELVQLGSPEDIFHRPTDRYVAEFVGTPPINLFDAELCESDGTRAVRVSSVEMRLGAPLHTPGVDAQWGKLERVTLGIRPRYVDLVAKQHADALPGIVEVVEPTGRETLLHIHLVTSAGERETGSFPSQGKPRMGLEAPPDVTARCLVPRADAPTEGTRVALSLRPEHVLLFHPETGVAL